MSYEMRNIRKEDLSLYYYIKDMILQDFIEKEEDILLQFVSSASCEDEGFYVYEALTSMAPEPTDRGRGWVYFDTCSGTVCNLPYLGSTFSGTRDDQRDYLLGDELFPTTSGLKEQSNRVVVYDADGYVIPESEYLIDYMDGRVVTSGTVTPVYVDYYWNYISVVDEWAAIEAADPPVVVLDIMGTDKTGYQLGAGKKIVRKVDIHVFATNTAERNDIVETIYDGLYLRNTLLYDFEKGSILDYDGTWYGRKENMNKLTTLFSRETVTGYLGTHCALQFDNVTARHVNLPLIMTRSRDEVMLSDLNAYRSKISFDLVSWTLS